MKSRSKHSFSLGMLLYLGSMMSVGQASSEQSSRASGTIESPAFILPCSNLASKEACSETAAENAKRASREGSPAAQPNGPVTASNVAALRRQADEEIILPALRKQEARWGNEVRVTPKPTKGVYTELFEPKEGVSAANKNKILINLHGGGFVAGGRTGGRLESLAIAGSGKIRVISIDYRLGPEYYFPAASEDVTTVYSELLKRYKPQSIGIYGCSAGGWLTAAAVAWFIKHKIPLPGAVGMFGNTGLNPFSGDSANIPTDGPALGERPLSSWPYLSHLRSEDDPLVSPMRFPDILKQFPPSLLTAGTRGPQLSSILYGANRLTLAGATVQLNVWDGVGECIETDASVPEGEEAVRIIVDFFAKHLRN